MEKNGVATIIVKLLTIFILCLTAYAVMQLLQTAWNTVQWNFPNHCREATENAAAVMFKNGKSPYYENYPHSYSVYGPLYYLFTSLFISSGSLLHSAFIQRLINWICIFSTMLIFVIFCKKRMPSSFIESFPLAAVLGVMLACYSNEIGSKPGCFAFMFAFLGTIIPFLCNFSERSFIIAVSCFAAAFLSKQIFLGFAAAFLGWHFLLFGIRRTLLLGAVFMLQTYGLLFLLEIIYPNITAPFSLKAFMSISKMSTTVLLMKLEQIIYLTWPIMLIVVAGFMAAVVKDLYMNKTGSFHLFLKGNYFFIVLCALFLYYLRIAMHRGNNNIYAVHTFIPVLFLAFLQYTSFYKKTFMRCVSFISLILALSAALSFFSGRLHLFSRDFSYSWEKWDSLISKHDNIYAHRVFAQTLAEHGKYIEYLGQEEYVKPSSSFFYEDDLAHKRKSIIADVKRAIDSAGYDLLLLHVKSGEVFFWWGKMTEEDLFAKGYLKVDEDTAYSTLYHWRIGVFKRVADIQVME